uniref:Uncharacterized protein n=1 Tax=Aotus nancymaae TaxID=37293 RepID=A0A2K5EGG0_AOTNA
MGSSQSVEIPGGGTEGYHVLRLPKLGRARGQPLQRGDCKGSLFRRRGLRRQVLTDLGAGEVTGKVSGAGDGKRNGMEVGSMDLNRLDFDKTFPLLCHS